MNNLELSSLQCRKTPMVLGDGLDNDCDGKRDEEILDGKDNDGDSYKDEDVAAVRHGIEAKCIVKIDISNMMNLLERMPSYW